jgi:LacI family transcriptional regulator
MMKPVARLRDVAERAGVSVSVVSRVLNSDPNLRVREDTRQRVLRAVGELNYTHNHAARALRLRRSGAIALLVPDVTNAIFSEIFRGVEDAAAEQDLVVLLGRSEWLDEKNNVVSRLSQQGRIDGLIIQLRDEEPSPHILDLLLPDMPTVLMHWHQRGGLSSVAIDDAEAARLAASFLIDLGHHSLGLIGGLPQTSTAQAREAGFGRALIDAGLKCQPEWMTRLGYTPSSGREAFRRIMSATHLPTALVVANINAAVGVLSAARDNGIEVPEQLSLVAIHDTWIAEHISPPLTTVRMPIYELGATAARVLIRVMDNGSKYHVLVRDPAPVMAVRGSHMPFPRAGACLISRQ